MAELKIRHYVLVCAVVLLPSLSAQSAPGFADGQSAGGPIAGLTQNELAAFLAGKAAFEEVDSVSGTLTEASGLGPRFNMDSCAGCHAQPATGGSSPRDNPQYAVASKAGAKNTIPSFITQKGPVREARFVKHADNSPDGGVYSLFVITGRTDAGNCRISQPDFAGELSRNNVVFRIPTPTFGNGLIEAITDWAIIANRDANQPAKRSLGITGHENRSANDGSVTRFGWKAQNKSLFVFAGEAYNVEQGVTNDVFAHERESSPDCRLNKTPEDHIDVNAPSLTEAPGDVILFTLFMRFLAPPSRGTIDGFVTRGDTVFQSIGCALCHTPSLQTGLSTTAALSNKSVNLYSDLLVHKMGAGLADGITQGNAGPDEFRTAPLWGLGQRLFFLHDGRTSDLDEAISAHKSQGSEANAVIDQYRALDSPSRQSLLRFLKSL